MFFYLTVAGFYLANFQASFVIWLVFFLNFCVLTAITYYHLYLEKVFSPFLSTFVAFNYIFFFAAPISQINEMTLMKTPVFLNNFPLKEPLIIKTALLILLFNVLFFLFYDYVKKRNYKKFLVKEEMVQHNNVALTIFVMMLLCVIIVAANFNFIIYEFNRAEWMESNVNKSVALIVSKVLFIFPLGAVIACKAYFSKKNNSANNTIVVAVCFLIILTMLLIVKNPFITKRHDLGPILFVFVFLFIPKLLNTNTKFLSVLFFSIIIGLPLSQLFTHTDYGIVELFAKPSRLLEQVNQGVLTEGYLSLNYDAFINIGIIIEAVQDNGFSYGFQLLSAILFFIPRSIWIDKPDASGTVVGKHLTENYEFYFQNVSNPFLSESYHNFGVVGVIVFAILLAISCVYMLGWINSNNIFKRVMAFYFSLHLIFILRGDFTSSFAYLVATFLGIYVLPAFIISIMSSKTIFKKMGVDGTL